MGENSYTIKELSKYKIDQILNMIILESDVSKSVDSTTQAAVKLLKLYLLEPEHINRYFIGGGGSG